jgi:hypothetical protein
MLNASLARGRICAFQGGLIVGRGLPVLGTAADHLLGDA